MQESDPEKIRAKGWMAIVAVQMFALTALAMSAGAQVVLYGAAAGCTDCQPEGSTLFTVAPTSGVASVVGDIVDADEIPFNNVTGMAFLRDGRLVASANGDDDGTKAAILIEIDPGSGLATLIGEIDNDDSGDCGRMPDLTYDPSTSTLYGIADSCFGGSEDDQFYRVDPATGAGTGVGPTGTDNGGNGLAWEPATGTLFHTPGDDEALWTIDRSDGSGTVVEGSEGNVGAPLDSNGLNALDFHPLTGVLYGSLKDGEAGDGFLVTVDTADGVTTIVGQFRNSNEVEIDGFDALAFRGPAGCPAGPVGPCRDSAAGGSKLKFTAKKGKGSWKWKGGQTAKADFGDPLTETDYRICTHDAAGGNPVLAAGQRVPAGAEWQDTSSGFKYKNKTGAPDGITKVTLKEGTDKAKIKAKGENIAGPALPASDDDRVVTQLLNSDGECWDSTFVGPAKKNDAEKFKAKN